MARPSFVRSTITLIGEIKIHAASRAPGLSSAPEIIENGRVHNGGGGAWREGEDERSGGERRALSLSRIALSLPGSSLEEKRKNARGLMLPRRSRQAKQTLFAILPGPVRTYRMFSAAFPREPPPFTLARSLVSFIPPPVSSSPPVLSSAPLPLGLVRKKINSQRSSYLFTRRFVPYRPV